eukprot:7304608-Heterocapsa_arctica.AAC.1
MRCPRPSGRGLPSLAGAGTGRPRLVSRGPGDAATLRLPTPMPGDPVGPHDHTAPEARHSRSPRGRPRRPPGQAVPSASSLSLCPGAS